MTPSSRPIWQRLEKREPQFCNLVPLKQNWTLVVLQSASSREKVGGTQRRGHRHFQTQNLLLHYLLNNEAAACNSKVVLPLSRKKIKKEKTCVPMEETDKASLRDRSFDGIGFVDSNLSFAKDVQEVKESGLEKASDMLVALCFTWEGDYGPISICTGT